MVDELRTNRMDRVDELQQSYPVATRPLRNAQHLDRCELVLLRRSPLPGMENLAAEFVQPNCGTRTKGTRSKLELWLVRKSLW